MTSSAAIAQQAIRTTKMHPGKLILMILKSIRLTTVLSAVLLVGSAAIPSRAQDLTAELQQAICTQQWAPAIKLVDQALAATPKSSKRRTELLSYRKRLQNLLNSNAKVPNGSTFCSDKAAPVAVAPSLSNSSTPTTTTNPDNTATPVTTNPSSVSSNIVPSNPPTTVNSANSGSTATPTDSGNLGSATPTPVVSSNSEQPGFTVKGTKIYDPAGQEFVIQGVNINGLNWVWPRDMTQDADSIATCWKFNLVRVNSLLLPQDGPKWPDNNDLDKLVAEFTKRKVVVMFEAHDRTGGYFADSDLTTLVNWYKQLAQKYKDNPYVWFDVMNEPGAASSPDQATWLNVHQQVISAIRDQASASNMILVEGSAWGQDAGAWNSDPVPKANSSILQDGSNLITFNGKTYNNIAFSIHAYDQWKFGDARLADYLDRVLAQNLAIVVGEYGVRNANQDTSQATESMFNVTVPRKIGRVVWHWFGGDENDLTTTNNGGGWYINSCTNPTNLTWLGQKVWSDTHQP